MQSLTGWQDHIKIVCKDELSPYHTTLYRAAVLGRVLSEFTIGSTFLSHSLMRRIEMVELEFYMNVKSTTESI
jgi:hypothetical protein